MRAVRPLNDCFANRTDRAYRGNQPGTLLALRASAGCACSRPDSIRGGEANPISTPWDISSGSLKSRGLGPSSSRRASFRLRCCRRSNTSSRSASLIPSKDCRRCEANSGHSCGSRPMNARDADDRPGDNAGVRGGRSGLSAPLRRDGWRGRLPGMSRTSRGRGRPPVAALRPPRRGASRPRSAGAASGARRSAPGLPG